jgi:colanic acid/amylovoran biosynthesis glycosyltransferase
MEKVLIFKETLLPSSETFILAQMMALTRHQPRLVGLQPVKHGLAIPEDAMLLSRRASPIASLRAKLYRRTGIAPWLHREARRFQPRFVHAHFASGGGTAMPLARALRVPLIVTLHGSDVTVRTPGRDAYRRLAEEATLFLCVSEFIRKQAIHAGFPAEKLVVHSIGIDRGVFTSAQPPPDSQRVLFVGRLVEKKGCEYLLRAMQLVQQQNPEAELVVIGDGPLRPQLQSLAGRLAVRCEFRGSQPAGMVRQEFEKARLLCVPSITARNGDSEGFGMVFAEAQAMGVPVVSSRHGGIPEAVADGVTGLLAPERDHESLAAALCWLLTDEQKWRSFSDAARERIAQRFDLKTQTAVLEDIYERVYSRH